MPDEDVKYWDMNQVFHKAKFEIALPYKLYMDASTEEQQSRWQAVYDRVTLTDAQKELLGSFTRKMNIFPSLLLVFMYKLLFF